MSVRFHSSRLCLIGSGLIGGSLALALKQAGAVDEVIGFARHEVTLQRARQLGIIDGYAQDLAQALRGADMVVLAVPMLAMPRLLENIRPHLQPDMLLTDVGSVKQSVITAARAALGEHVAAFVPGHPIAGTEKSGPDAAFAELFVQRRVVVTPLEENAERDVQRVVAMWRTVGAQVDCMTAQAHDYVLARTSHLPHVLAFALVDLLARSDAGQDVFRYAAGGFRDFTRIAASDPTMWRDIALANREELLAALQSYQHALQQLTQHVQQADGEALFALFHHAQQVREGLQF